MGDFSLSGGVEITGFISPTDTADTYPVIDTLYGIDGLRNVDNLTQLNAIPNERRRPGMLVGVSGGTQYYKLNPSPWTGTTDDWTIFTTGGGSFTGNTSGDCITDLYITNLYGCSPITVNDNLQHISSSATGINSIAWGTGTTASGIYSHAEGRFTIASGETSHAEGYFVIAGGRHSHAEGYRTTASGNYSHAEGKSTIASGLASHAEGDNAQSIGMASHAEGRRTYAIGPYSHSEGVGTSATTNGSHAEGALTTASGTHSHAEGYGSIASGNYGSHAEGDNTTASGNYGSHAEGVNTLASGESSHAEGSETIASGYFSHAQGNNTTASGAGSHSGGRGRGKGSRIIASGDTSFIHFHQTSASGIIGAYGDYSAILGGTDHNIGTGSTSSGIFVGSGNTISDNVLRSVVIGGSNITGTTNDTVYVPNLNIGTVGGGTSVNNLGIDINGNVVSDGYIEVNITSAQILTLGSTPVSILSTPGANKYYEYYGEAEYTHVSTAYTLANDLLGVLGENTYSGGLIHPGLINSARNQVSQFTSSGPVDGTTSGDEYYGSFAKQPNEGVVLATLNGTEPTLGDGTILVKIWYKVRTFGSEL